VVSGGGETNHLCEKRGAYRLKEGKHLQGNTVATRWKKADRKQEISNEKLRRPTRLARRNTKEIHVPAKIGGKKKPIATVGGRAEWRRLWNHVNLRDEGGIRVEPVNVRHKKKKKCKKVSLSRKKGDKTVKEKTKLRSRWVGVKGKGRAKKEDSNGRIPRNQGREKGSKWPGCEQGEKGRVLRGLVKTQGGKEGGGDPFSRPVHGARTNRAPVTAVETRKQGYSTGG